MIAPIAVRLALLQSAALAEMASLWSDGDPTPDADASASAAAAPVAPAGDAAPDSADAASVRLLPAEMSTRGRDAFSSPSLAGLRARSAARPTIAGAATPGRAGQPSDAGCANAPSSSASAPAFAGPASGTPEWIGIEGAATAPGLPLARPTAAPTALARAAEPALQRRAALSLPSRADPAPRAVPAGIPPIRPPQPAIAVPSAGSAAPPQAAQTPAPSTDAEPVDPLARPAAAMAGADTDVANLPLGDDPRFGAPAGAGRAVSPGMPAGADACAPDGGVAIRISAPESAAPGGVCRDDKAVVPRPGRVGPGLDAAFGIAPAPSPLGRARAPMLTPAQDRGAAASPTERRPASLAGRAPAAADPPVFEGAPPADGSAPPSAADPVRAAARGTATDDAPRRDPDAPSVERGEVGGRAAAWPARTGAHIRPHAEAADFTIRGAPAEAGRRGSDLAEDAPFGPAPEASALGEALMALAGQSWSGAAGTIIACAVFNAAMIPGWPPPRPFDVPELGAAVAGAMPKPRDAEAVLARFDARGGALLGQQLRGLLKRISARRRRRLVAALAAVMDMIDAVLTAVEAELLLAARARAAEGDDLAAADLRRRLTA